MILDKGICEIYSVSDDAAPGDMPVEKLALKGRGWYGELDFATVPVDAGMQEMTEISARIRILQNRAVSNQDVVSIGRERFEVTRAYHGTDKDNGQPITDLTLKRLVTGDEAD